MDVVDRLLKSDEPCIRYLTRVRALDEDPVIPALRRLRSAIRRSERATRLLSECLEGRAPGGVYGKWRGPHWVLTVLSDTGYPESDRRLKPLVDRCLDWARGLTVQMIDGRPRRCASQEGNALLYAIQLGFYDRRCDELADKLMAIQWPDGGWNCDRKPQACHASFHESLIPMRALNAYAGTTGCRAARKAVRAAAEMFLERRLFRRKTTGEVIRPRFAAIHYPFYWQYTFLHGLKAMKEAGLLGDPRCGEALALLESKRLCDGGFPAERKYYSVAMTDEKRHRSGQSLVSWGPHTTRKTGASNPFVTVEALAVLKGRAGERGSARAGERAFAQRPDREGPG